MKKTFDAETILKAAIMLSKAERIVYDAIVLLAGAIRISAIERVMKARERMWVAVHSLESHWVRAVAREVGCLENEVPFDCPENALKFFEIHNPKRRSALGDATNMILCWDAESDRVKLVPWPDAVRESNEYDFSCLAPWTHVRQADFETRKKIVFIEAMHLIVRDKCDPLAVHSALLGLAEYRDGLSDDAPR